MQLAVDSLTTMPKLTVLHINLHREEEVDFLLRSLPDLIELNGLVVERDAIFSEEDGSSENESEMNTTVLNNRIEGSFK